MHTDTSGLYLECTRRPKHMLLAVCSITANLQELQDWKHLWIVNILPRGMVSGRPRELAGRLVHTSSTVAGHNWWILRFRRSVPGLAMGVV